MKCSFVPTFIRQANDRRKLFQNLTKFKKYKHYPPIPSNHKLTNSYKVQLVSIKIETNHSQYADNYRLVI